MRQPGRIFPGLVGNQMSNRVTLEQAAKMSVKEVANLPIDMLALLQEDVAQLKASTKAVDDHLFAAMSLRFSDRAAEVRKAKGTDTGTVRLTDGDFVVVADLPKKITWSQSGLESVEADIIAMNEPVSDYISVKRDVSERAYEGWPSSLKKLFEPHRTVGVGKGGFKVEVKKGAA